MSYQYRKKKRELCHRVLKTLNTSVFENIKENKHGVHVNIHDALGLSPDGDSEFSLYYGAMSLLWNNDHISSNKESYKFHLVTITTKGMEAFNESYYLKEIEKDRLESIELYTRWLFPALSLLVSFCALWVAYHYHK